MPYVKLLSDEGVVSIKSTWAVKLYHSGLP